MGVEEQVNIYRNDEIPVFEILDQALIIHRLHCASVLGYKIYMIFMVRKSSRFKWFRDRQTNRSQSSGDVLYTLLISIMVTRLILWK